MQDESKLPVSENLNQNLNPTIVAKELVRIYNSVTEFLNKNSIKNTEPGTQTENLIANLPEIENSDLQDHLTNLKRTVSKNSLDQEFSKSMNNIWLNDTVGTNNALLDDLANNLKISSSDQKTIVQRLKNLHYMKEICTLTLAIMCSKNAELRTLKEKFIFQKSIRNSLQVMYILYITYLTHEPSAIRPQILEKHLNLLKKEFDWLDSALIKT